MPKAWAACGSAGLAAAVARSLAGVPRWDFAVSFFGRRTGRPGGSRREGHEPAPAQRLRPVLEACPGFEASRPSTQLTRLPGSLFVSRNALSDPSFLMAAVKGLL